MSGAFPPANYRDRFDWQYFKHPSFCELIFAEIDGLVAGMVGIEMRRLSDGTPCAMLIDLAIRLEYRGRGLSHVLEQELVERALAREASAVVSLPNAAGAGALGQTSGWNILAPIPLYRYDGGQLPAPSAADELATSEPVFFDRSPAEWAWRIDRHAIHHYLRIGGTGEQAICKLFRGHSSEPPVGDIVFVPQEVPSRLTDIYRTALEELVRRGAQRVETWALAHSPEAHVLATLGFGCHAQARSLAVKVLSPEKAMLRDASSWRIQPVDIEHF